MYNYTILLPKKQSQAKKNWFSMYMYFLKTIIN